MTNKTISLTIPNDDPIALHEFGAAMQRMAGRHGLDVSTIIADVPNEPRPISVDVTFDTDKAQLAALGADTGPDYPDGPEFEGWNDRSEPSVPDTIVTSSPHLDSDGLPWDARIHASSKERNADDTWRARRKPSDMDAGQWAEFQGQVRTELRALMELPVEATVTDPEVIDKIDADHPNVSEGYNVEQEVAMVFSEQPVVVEPVEPEPIVVTPPPVVAPPAPVEPVVPVAPPAPVEPVVPVAPPAPTGTAPTEFVPFLQWITSSGITPEQVNIALAQHGLTAVPQLQQRPDLIPQVHATLAAGV